MIKPAHKPLKQVACASNPRPSQGKWIPAFVIWLLTPLLWAEVSHGLPFDLQGFIDRKLSEGENYIQLPQGRHRVAVVTNLSHLNLNGLQDITIDGTGSELICTQTTRAITIKNCHNLKLVGLTIDYDPLPFTQGRIVGISGDKLTVEVEIMAGYPDADTLTGNKIEIFGGETSELVTTTYYNVSFKTMPGARRFSLRKPANYRDVSKENVGDIVVATSAYAPGGSKPHAIYMDASTNVTMEDVTLYASNMFGFFETNCSGSRYFRCVVDRRPLIEDLRPRTHQRMRSLEADGFHSKFALVGPSYIECVSRYNGDDGIAINGDYHVITGSKGNRLRVVGKMGTDPKLKPGTRVELVSYKGERIEDAWVCAIAPARSVSLTETRFLEEQGFYGDVARTSSAKRAWTVTLDREVDLPMGSLIADTSRVGNYFLVKNCTIGPNRSRGILVKASDGSISENLLVDNWLQAIKMAPEYKWLEAGSGNNITVSGNTIMGCRDVAIEITATAGSGAFAPAGAHQNVRVVNNSIRHSTNPAIVITSTRGLELHQNTVKSPDNSLIKAWETAKYGRKEDPNRTVFLHNVEDARTDPAGP